MNSRKLSFCKSSVVWSGFCVILLLAVSVLSEFSKKNTLSNAFVYPASAGSEYRAGTISEYATKSVDVATGTVTVTVANTDCSKVGGVYFSYIFGAGLPPGCFNTNGGSPSCKGSCTCPQGETLTKMPYPSDHLSLPLLSWYPLESFGCWNPNSKSGAAFDGNYNFDMVCSSKYYFINNDRSVTCATRTGDPGSVNTCASGFTFNSSDSSCRATSCSKGVLSGLKCVQVCDQGSQDVFNNYTKKCEHCSNGAAIVTRNGWDSCAN